jgi:hypothetical protein
MQAGVIELGRHTFQRRGIGAGQREPARPGSWEAAKVREILESTVGADDESLCEHRTEPITVNLWVENVLLDLDDPTLEQHDATLAELYDRQDAIPGPDDVDTTPAFDWLTDPDWINDPEKVATVEKLQASSPRTHPHPASRQNRPPSTRSPSSATALRPSTTRSWAPTHTTWPPPSPSTSNSCTSVCRSISPSRRHLLVRTCATAPLPYSVR